MSKHTRNAYLDHGLSDDSDSDAGYDSEAAEVSKVERPSKRRRIEPEDVSGDEEEDDDTFERAARVSKTTKSRPAKQQRRNVDDDDDGDDNEDDADEDDGDEDDEIDNNEESKIAHGPPALQKTTSNPQPVTHDEPDDSSIPKSTTNARKRDKKPTRPGVIYLSSLPPYLRPSALRNLLVQRGFAPLNRIFLAPASKSKGGGSKNTRQLYTEGWIEFASHKMARRCAETLNANPVGGRKGGWYHDDVWNMKYLRGMSWEELMAGIRGEKREEEGRRDEERRIIARETKAFVEGVEEGKRIKGIEATRRKRGGPAEAEVRRTWRQHEVKGKKKKSNMDDDKIGDEAREVLSKIF